MNDPHTMLIAIMAFLCGAGTTVLIALTINASRELANLSLHPGPDPADMLDPHPPGPVSQLPVPK